MTSYEIDMNASFEAVQTWIMHFFIKIFFTNNAKKVSKQVFACETWDQKLTVCYELVNRTMMMLVMDSTKFPVLKNCKITHLRGSESIKTKLAGLGDDYDLQKLSLQPMSNIVLEGSHVTIIFNPELSEIINNLL
jgi:hypothetical protein